LLHLVEVAQSGVMADYGQGVAPRYQLDISEMSAKLG
jgi:hypothetical protein